VIIILAGLIFISINFKTLICGTDYLFSYNFDSLILILPKYFGGANRANLCNTITNQVNYFLQQYMFELLKATKDDGCNVIGYLMYL
jgi:hypothetical protein